MFLHKKFSIFDFDIYSKRISFYYNAKEKIGSFLGFVLTIVYIMSIIFLSFYYCIRLLKRKDIKIHDSTMYSQGIPNIDINQNLLYFAFGLEDPTSNSRYIDETIYLPIIYFIKMEKENGLLVTKKKVMLNLERCNASKFGEKYQSLLDQNELNNSYCLQNFNLSLSGGFKYDQFSYIRIKIQPCINSSENNFHCKPQNIIDTYLSSAYFSILIKDIGLNPLNYNIPVIPILQNLYTTIDKSILRDFFIYFGIIEVQTDLGLLSTNLKKEKYLQFRQYHDTFIFRDIEDYHSGKDIFTAQIRLEEYIKIQKRTYTKFPEIFSLIGGYMQLLYTIFTLMIILTKNINIEKKLLNSLFNFNLKERKIIISIQYEKKLNYLAHTDKGDINNFIPFIARKINLKCIKNTYAKNNNSSNYNNYYTHKKNEIICLNKNNSFIPLIKKSISGSVHFKNDTKNKIKNYSDKGVSQFHKLSKYKNTNFNDEQNANRSKINMLFKSNEEINSHFKNNLKKMKKNNRKITDDSEKKENEIDDESISDIKFNIFDFFCNFGKIENKRADIELFYSGVTFYRNLMNIIHFFNIIFMTEIMLNHKSCKKLSYFNQTLEIPVRAEKGQ